MFFKLYENQKIYILQNNLWKDEIINYIKSYSVGNVVNNINLIQNNEFIIRIYEQGTNKIEQVFASKIKLPNKADIYVFIKSRDLPLILNDHKYFIEVEKKYEKNIRNMKFNTNSVSDFLKQMIYCQMNLFCSQGIIHNNIHVGNIFIDENKDKHEFNYKYINKIYKSKLCYILSDFVKCKIFHPLKFSGFIQEEIYDKSLLKNLEDTVKLSFNLFDNNLFNSDLNFKIQVSEDLKKKHYNLVKPYIENFELYKKEYNDFKYQILNLCWDYINPIFEIFHNQIFK